MTSFPAKFYGRCPTCEERIFPGQLVRYADDESGKVMHDICAPPPDERPQPGNPVRTFFD